MCATPSISFGGNLGTTGCVSFMFNKKGVIVIEREGLDEDTVMSDALEAGASDFAADEDVFEISTEPDDFSGVREDLEKKGYEFVSADVEMVPDTYTKIDDEEVIVKMQKMLDLLEDNDDVQTCGTTGTPPKRKKRNKSGTMVLGKKQMPVQGRRGRVSRRPFGENYSLIWQDHLGKEGTLCDT